MEMQLIYDEERVVEKRGVWEGADTNAVDVFHLRVRLFKGEGVVSRVRGSGVEKHPVYLQLLDYEDYTGPTDDFGAWEARGEERLLPRCIKILKLLRIERFRIGRIAIAERCR